MGFADCEYYQVVSPHFGCYLTVSPVFPHNADVQWTYKTVIRRGADLVTTEKSRPSSWSVIILPSSPRADFKWISLFPLVGAFLAWLFSTGCNCLLHTRTTFLPELEAAVTTKELQANKKSCMVCEELYTEKSKNSILQRTFTTYHGEFWNQHYFFKWPKCYRMSWGVELITRLRISYDTYITERTDLNYCAVSCPD